MAGVDVRSRVEVGWAEQAERQAAAAGVGTADAVLEECTLLSAVVAAVVVVVAAVRVWQAVAAVTVA